MAQNSDNIAIVRPVTDGAAWTAPTTATMPTGAASALSGFSSLGWLTEDGIIMTINREVTELKGFGGDTALTIQTSHAVQFKIKPMEVNEATLGEAFGLDNVITEGTGASKKVTGVKVNGDELGERAWVYDLRGRNNQLIRIVAPKCKVNTVGDILFKTGEPALTGEITLDALPDDDGNKAYIYFGTAASGKSGE